MEKAQIDLELLGEALDVIDGYQKLCDQFAVELGIGKYPENKDLHDQWQVTEVIANRVALDIIKAVRLENKDGRD